MFLKAYFTKLTGKRSPAGIALIYAVFGALWLIASHFLLDADTGKSNLIQFTEVVSYLTFVVISSFVLYAILRNSNDARPESARLPQPIAKKSGRAYLAVIFISLIMVVPAINYIATKLYTPRVEDDAYKSLGVIARVKLVQFERWRASRKADAEVLAADRSFAELVDKLQKQHANDAEDRIIERLDAIISAYEFEGAELVDLNGNDIIRRGTKVGTDKVKQSLMTGALETREADYSDLYMVGDQRIQLDLIAPISLQRDKKPVVIAFVIIHTSVDHFILPRVLSWPNSSSSGEILLTQAEDTHLNIIRLLQTIRKQSALLQIPLANIGTLAKDNNAHSGKDYQGKLVYSAQETIHDSSWQINAQIDQAEVMAPLNTFLFWISVIAFTAIALVSATLILLWRQQRRSHALELLAESTERDRLLKRFYDMPFIGMGVIDPVNHRWLQVNAQMCEIFGYTHDELMQLSCEEITHPDEIETDQQFYDRLVRGEIEYYQREKRYLHKSGSIIIGQIELNRVLKANGEIELYLAAIEDITERKQAEEALKRSEERLSLVFQGTNDGWWDIDIVHNIAYHSPRWWSMLGYGPDQDTIDPTLWQRITHPDDIKDTLLIIRSALSSSEQNSYELEVRLLHQDGHYVPVLTRAFITRDKAGKPIRVSGANMDLTERKVAAEALRAQEEFNRVLLENQADAVTACDANMNVVLFNHVARDWHGINVMDVPTGQWSNYYKLYNSTGEVELLPEQAPLLRAYHGEYIQNENIAIKANNQEIRFVSCSAAPFYDDNGNQLGAVAIMRDITEMLRHTKALHESELLYREMFEANAHPMWVFDLDTLAFLAVNDAAIKRYGWTRDEFLSMNVGQIRSDSELIRLKAIIENLDESRRYAGETRHIKKDGSEIDVEITSYPITFAGQRAQLVLAYDITERKHNDLEIRTLNRLLLMLTNINQTIVQRLEPSQMFFDACNIAVRDGQFRMAWIGLIQPNGNKLEPVAHAGEIGDYLNHLDIDLDDLTLKGPTLRCIRGNHYVVCANISEDPDYMPWVQQAMAHGYRSSVALPLRKDGKVIGSFNLYSAEVGVFNQRELDLLDELAGDISFALEVAEAEKERKHAENALRESEALFHVLASSSPVGIFRTDEFGHGIYHNERWSKITGTANQDALGENRWSQSLHEDDRERVFTTIDEALRNKHGFNMEYRFKQPDGNIVWVKGQAEAKIDTNGNFNGFVGTLTDITALKASEESLRMTAAVFENTREGIMVTDADNHIIMANRAFTDITRFKLSDVIGKTPKIMSSGRHDRDFFHRMWQSLNEIGHWQGEIWNRRGNGDIHPVLMSISEIKNEAGERTNYMGVFADISNLKASEAQLEFLAHHDPLTRLPNRLMLISRLGHAIEVARRDNSQLALLMLDLDRFKNVNDSFGHLAGDELLQQVAKRLTERLRGVDTVTRLGGDEFTVLLEEIAQPEDAARVAESIISSLENAWTLSNGVEVRIGASVGISVYPGHGDTALELLQHADAALYQAKAAGRGCARYFSESLTQAARSRFNIEARLRQALPNNELRLYYQPKIDVATGRIVGAEALVRWLDPVDGLIMPLSFISIAEETGLISAIGEWVLREACDQGKRWIDAGMPSLSVAVNLSAHQLYHGDIVKTLSTALEKSHFPAEHLELELTESILMQREDEIVETLSALRNKGVRLAIDDFGTGYSSLSYLKSFPLDVLKIDRSFVKDIEEDSDDRAITATIIGIAHTLGMQVVAEGVETEQQLDFLRLHHCDMYQGYLVSPPVPVEEFEMLLLAFR